MAERQAGPEKSDDEALTPKKKQALLKYLSVMFAVAFLLVALSLLVRIHSVEDDMEALDHGVRENIVSMEKDLENIRAENETLRSELDSTLYSAKAVELLALAQDALQRDDTVAFHGYMAELEGYADALSPDTAEIYAALTTALP